MRKQSTIRNKITDAKKKIRLVGSAENQSWAKILVRAKHDLSNLLSTEHTFMSPMPGLSILNDSFQGKPFDARKVRWLPVFYTNTQ